MAWDLPLAAQYLLTRTATGFSLSWSAVSELYQQLETSSFFVPGTKHLLHCPRLKLWWPSWSPGVASGCRDRG